MRDLSSIVSSVSQNPAFQSEYPSGFNKLTNAEEVLVGFSGLSEEEVIAAIAEHFNLQLIDYGNAIDFIDEFKVQDALHNSEIEWTFLKGKNWYPLSREDDNLHIVTNRPLCNAAKNFLRLADVQYTLIVTDKTLLQRVVSIVEGLENEAKEASEELEKIRALASETPVVNLVNSLISRALDMGASDMHVEPTKEGGIVRVRVDGLLHKLDTIPASLVLAVVSRLKILADMDIAEKRRPQDGKIALKHKNIDIRVSCLPLNNGESVVMRFLVKGSLKLDLNDLGFHHDLVEHIQQDLDRTSGVILMTGPTGSGKTTTLYSFLDSLNDIHEKIITLEDPVEYEIEGINQIQVKPDIGFDFAAGIRSIVRQDPDVIMVGEIRDSETARIAMQSALTGHLVFSTVHTNDAPSAYVRLIDLGVDEFLLNSAVVAILAQRLTRKLCEHCKEPDPHATEHIAKLELDKLAQQCGIEDITINRAVGCEHCKGTGYQGRLAILEYLPNVDHIKSLPKDSNFALSAEQFMRKQGYRSLKQDGLLKVLQGQTTIEEVMRVAG
ncbi:GspE/PulE family protein [Pseudoalteromonas ruthenica]|uniref:Bacterial type II secretion system protein E domain-containing protein n=1 Tax=Pseudoalteromonas ruthenica TaxID=151081 RepID=A0A0F4PU79_9GAMM|nr:ATPase, T2SS/T4P/T4SS family [Pseudoalteromonas ruthenica]KJY95003.1 hypothetical protein TW76_16210 [Pseudoalteromonas ruthenica]KJY98684.1 hypothetical protein TW72_13255 [Pseudoalteromonas ruthenica]TLX51299.1 type II/IV secretion system protein [Pseudoalteromonas ruthenica]TMO86977.1 type II/IV secretion system protein [Pseudoalteromonas ruthenica]TMO93763.1 type II/IV secretion system protein [Pseudoalteromonas ruthenica]|tara:strand:+ start:22076 stop:23731 length:1656 start_codon:yes stop_codon:yes gene_type:complete